MINRVASGSYLVKILIQKEHKDQMQMVSSGGMKTPDSIQKSVKTLLEELSS
jgi:hypothetical protein